MGGTFKRSLWVVILEAKDPCLEAQKNETNPIVENFLSGYDVRRNFKV
jgi:hypothetical protein